MRDVYDDMLLDGIKPERDTFHSLLIGTMKGARLQDAFFFREEMKAMGFVPDVFIDPFLPTISIFFQTPVLLTSHICIYIYLARPIITGFFVQFLDIYLWKMQKF